MTKSTKKEQIYQLVKKRIERGVYAPGSRLPKEEDFAAELGISRKTLRPVLEQLDKENRIERIKGIGTFVRDAGKFQTRILLVAHEFTDDLSNPNFFIMPGVQLEAQRLNIHIETCSHASLLSDSADKMAVQIVEKGFQGIIYFASNFHGNESMVEVLRKTNLPILLPHALRKDWERTGFSVMGTDYMQVMEDGLRYLAAQGHRRVGHITTDDMRGIKHEEYFRLARNAGLSDDPALLCITGRNKDEVQRATAQLMTGLAQPPTAVFCFADFFALYVYEYLQKNNIRIPDDVAVLSIGGQIGCNILSPSLSAIDFMSMDIGMNAVHNMFDMIKNGSTFNFAVTPHRIIERESTRKFFKPEEEK